MNRFPFTSWLGVWLCTTMAPRLFAIAVFQATVFVVGARGRLGRREQDAGSLALAPFRLTTLWTVQSGAADHRAYSRHGEAFDVGVTFSGVDFETGLEAGRRLAPLMAEGATMAQWALRFVLDQPGVSVVTPGARDPEQARANAGAAALAPLSGFRTRGGARGATTSSSQDWTTLSRAG